MKRRAARALASLVVLAALAAAASSESAYGQPVSLADDPLEVQLWLGGDPGHTLFVVTGHLPEDVSLPATVRLPLPANARILWSGEIFGGPVSEDPAREGSTVEVDGGHAFEMTAETTRTVQYEAVGPPLSISDGVTKSVFEWVQTVEAGEVSFSVRVPAHAGEVRLDPDAPGPPRTNETGERLYTLRPVLLSEGQAFTVTAAYGREEPTGADEGFPAVLTAVLAALGVALIVLILTVAAQRRRSG